MISLNTAVWVWGEHGGFLDDLLKGMAAYEGSSELSSLVFERQFPEEDTHLVELMRSDGLPVWLNRLRRGDLRAELRGLIERLFSRGVPQGWTGWGFKEPRYGARNNAPAHLLDLFPEGIAAFIFREPSATFASGMRTWYPEQLQKDRLGELPQFYQEEIVSWWLDTVKYFVDLKKARSSQIVMVEMQQLNRSPEAVLQSLGLPLRASCLVLPSITNRGPAAPSDFAEEAMASCFERWREETLSVYQTALALCD